MQHGNLQFTSEKATDQTYTSKDKTSNGKVSDSDLLMAGFEFMRQLADRFGGFKLRFNGSTGKVLSFDMLGSQLYYCRKCNGLKLLDDMPEISSNGALCKKHSSMKVDTK